ncbi:hypothetical protein BVG16_30605 [Paenibacillus selenitireducens]|uniref:Uncharacterized protein n=1 Tax=Paenibacillus selenitireducens TaxID=1324314 RepID=A0A1T2WZX6_9BACL|nr:hypothetical protein [Paenibacillus selenitireducens]OPA73026.1 hypothetical protein BVG16_30605 [Paenibacillus selenitireducens]
MGWSELRRIPNEYNETIKEIDERIIDLIYTRRSITEGRRFFPSSEQITQWSLRFQMDESQIRFIIHNLQDQVRPIIPDEIGELQNVLSIMKKSIVESCEYTLTHSMQYKNVSIVFVDIRLQNAEQREVHLKPNLLLEIISDQQFLVRRYGSHGGGAQTEMQFIISPPIPETLDNLEFSLVPSANFLERKIQEIVLDKQIDFN